MRRTRMPNKKSTGTSAVAVNRKARHEFFILDTYEAGIALKGSEVKSIRLGAVNLKEGYVHIRNGEAFHTGCIPFYKHFQTAVKSCSQGGVRGGAATVFAGRLVLEYIVTGRGGYNQA